MSRFPAVRLRRLRANERSRRTVRETRVPPSSLILPVFVDPTLRRPQGLPALPALTRHPPEALLPLARRAERAGLGGLLLFGRPRRKDPEGTGAWDEAGAVPRALRSLRSRTRLLLVADVCLCAYTTDGHCGYWKEGEVENDRSLVGLARAAVTYARAGADWLAPSAMLDGQVGAVREALDAAGYAGRAILAYSAKSASAFYDPFRDVEDSSPRQGDRRGYQMDYGNPREALREMALDMEEGADLVMVKPGLPQLDLLARARERFPLPLAVYQVSGEYAMMKDAAGAGHLDESRAVPEVLTAFRRAGADVILSYYALEAVEQGWI